MITRTTRVPDHFYGPGSTGHMNYGPEFNLLATLRGGGHHLSLPSEEAEVQRCEVSAQDYKAPGWRMCYTHSLLVHCWETGSVNSPCSCTRTESLTAPLVPT